MSTKPLVSIGLFLYNGDRFLEAAIESFLNQTFRDFELIISDNCSTDKSDEICRRYAAQDSRIRYYRNQRNMGAGWNVRRVYELATGKYFKQAAHDDMIQPDYLRQCVDALEADESLVLAHSLTRVIDEHGQFVENYDDGLRTSSVDPVVRARDLLLKGHRCYPIFGLIRLDALHKLPPQGSYAHSDRVLLLQLGLLGRYCEIPEYLFISTRHSGQSVWTEPERTKAKGFRLTRRCGTLPAMEWWDPTKARKIVFPEWNVAREFFLSVVHSPLTPWQKLKCYGLVGRWMLKYHRRMAKDVLLAADQVLFNFQNRHAMAAKTPETADASSKIVSLDLNTSGGESL
jgi:glycosyltransferase involved in cell wall biosynthesis